LEELFYAYPDSISLFFKEAFPCRFEFKAHPKAACSLFEDPNAPALALRVIELDDSD
jgi:hypothetical protein